MVFVRRKIVPLLMVIALTLVIAPSAYARVGTLMMTHNPVLGNILTDMQGRTLYRFTKDTVNVNSACYNRCATVWPPLLITDGSPIATEGVDGDLLGVLERSDGTRQVMYNGMPLYYYQNDMAPGDIKGQGVNGIWFIVKPNSTTVGNQPVGVHAMNNATLGNILTDQQGMTLYLFTRDKENLSVCYDRCATIWPPLLVGNVTPTLAEGLGGTLGTTLRNDGNYQVTYNGKPLYYYYTDTAPGDTKGQGVGNVWWVLNPTAP